MGLQSLQYQRGSLKVLDQKLLPATTTWVDVEGTKDAWTVISAMTVRGAPLIAIVAVLGLAVELHGMQGGSAGGASEAADFVVKKLDYLRTSRPTAVNLFNACDDLVKIVQEEQGKEGATWDSVADACVLAAERLHEEDLAANRQQGKLGAEAILSHPAVQGKQGVRVLTHCNTGSLATSGYGTALGVIRALQEQGKLEACYATETRPYNQGARLTAYEFVQDGLPGTLVTDSMASFLMLKKGIDAVVVGADRVVANGDTANKIGTYQLAIAAKHHGIPFLVVAPVTTLDAATPTGEGIHIEERPAKELTHLGGKPLAPEGIGVWNPAFDVTPAALITYFVTDRGVLRPVVGENGAGVRFDIPGFLAQGGPAPDGQSPPQSALEVPPGYRELSGEDAAQYVHSTPELRSVVGSREASEVHAQEVGDGNMNYVFICRGPSGSVVLKQALPYVRCVGESWPLTLDRAYHESEALLAQRKACPEHTPEVYHFNRDMGVLVMQYIEPPHIILRKGLIAGARYPTLAGDLASFLARTLFFTSGLHLPGPDLRKAVAKWSHNHPLCALTEQVVFTDPYIASPLNRWTSPALDDTVASIRADTELKLAISVLKAKFMGQTQALIHGDLHTGSVMVKEGSTYCIDPEFAFYGPMGFDLGAILGNLLLAFFARPGHADKGDGEYGDWILDQVLQLWTEFKRQFLELWSDDKLHTGDDFKRTMYGAGELAAVQGDYMRRLLQESLGFAGAKMIRRIIGIAHVEDFESIADVPTRARCEEQALRFARTLVTQGGTDIEEVVRRVREVC